MGLWCLGVASSRVMVVSHHKSGTVASQQLILALCGCEGHPTGRAFWTTWHDCEKKCSEREVVYLRNGAGNVELRPDDRIVHFVRSPRDMIVSGYNYHRDCSEPWLRHWTAERTATLRWPPLAAHIYFKAYADGQFRDDYCEFLQEAPREFGVFAEAVRTISASDGIGAMLTQFKRQRGKPHPEILTVCLNDVNVMSETEATISTTWHRVADHVNITFADIQARLVSADVAANHSHAGKDIELSRLAKYADTALDLYYKKDPIINDFEAMCPTRIPSSSSSI